MEVAAADGTHIHTLFRIRIRTRAADYETPIFTSVWDVKRDGARRVSDKIHAKHAS